MPYHTGGSGKSPMKPKKAMKPLNKPRKDLYALQKKLMKSHNSHHTPKHMTEMRKLMKAGYCFEQSHRIAMRKVGK